MSGQAWGSQLYSWGLPLQLVMHRERAKGKSPEGDLASSLRARPGCPRPATGGATHSTLHKPLLGSPSPEAPAAPAFDTSLSCLLPEHTGLGVQLGGLLPNSQVTPRVLWTVRGTL